MHVDVIISQMNYLLAKAIQSLIYKHFTTLNEWNLHWTHTSAAEPQGCEKHAASAEILSFFPLLDHKAPDTESCKNHQDL